MCENELVVEQANEPVAAGKEDTGSISATAGELVATGEDKLPVKQEAVTAIGNILENPDTFLATAKMAKMLSSAQILPKTFAGNPGNCMILIDMAKRSGMSVLFVAQNLYVVSGNPSWSGQACIALINNSGRFKPLKFEEVYNGLEDWSCAAYATEKATGEVLKSTTVDFHMAKEAGWWDKNGSFWKKMPMQMARYRAAAFFARTYCPEALFGLYTDMEQKDIHGWEEKSPTSKFSL